MCTFKPIHTYAQQKKMKKTVWLVLSAAICVSFGLRWIFFHVLMWCVADGGPLCLFFFPTYHCQWIMELRRKSAESVKIGATVPFSVNTAYCEGFYFEDPWIVLYVFFVETNLSTIHIYSEMVFNGFKVTFIDFWRFYVSSSQIR